MSGSVLLYSLFSAALYNLPKPQLRKIFLRLRQIIRRKVYAARVDGVVHLLLGRAREEEDETFSFNEIRAFKRLLYALGVGLRAGERDAVESVVDRFVKSLHRIGHKGHRLELGIVILEIFQRRAVSRLDYGALDEVVLAEHFDHDIDALRAEILDLDDLEGLIVVADEEVEGLLEGRYAAAAELLAEFYSRVELFYLLKGHKADRAEAVRGALDGLIVHNYGHVVAAEVNVVFKNVAASVKCRAEGFERILGIKILDPSVRRDLNILSCCVFPSDSHEIFSFPLVICLDLW